jgi:hypothetical protein
MIGRHISESEGAKADSESRINPGLSKRAQSSHEFDIISPKDF